jgi:hypothetical protein
VIGTSRVRRLQVAITGVAVVTMTTALISFAVPAGASQGSPPPGEVLCKTLTVSSSGWVLGRCTDKAETGGYGNLNSANLFEQDGHVRIIWASGKSTVFKVDLIQESLGACGMQYDDFWHIEGGILRDRTGSITAPVSLDLCGPEPNWVLEDTAQI